MVHGFFPYQSSSDMTAEKELQLPEHDSNFELAGISPEFSRRPGPGPLRQPGLAGAAGSSHTSKVAGSVLPE